MPYSVLWTDKALKNLKRLPRETAARIIAAVERARDNPFDHLQRLSQSPYFKLRVGKYRLIIDVKRTALIIYVIKVGKREHVYDNR